MEDVGGRMPSDLPSLQNIEPATVPTVDGWIERLMTCKQLTESEVQRLCEKVSWTVSRTDVLQALDLVVKTV